jgi:Flp pilus assembly pilin Flp
MKKFLLAFVHNTEGQDLIEYALLGATISLGIGAIIVLINAQLVIKYNAINADLGGS